MGTTTAVVGFYTAESMQLWFFNTEADGGVKILREKEKEPKGDGSPHIIMELEVESLSVFDRLYPEGIILNGSFDEN